MTALFADTFYWIALADSTDGAHQHAVSFTIERATSEVFTTDEVLTEYLNFFSSAPRAFRRQAANSVEGLLTNSVVRVIPQSRDSFRAGLSSIASAPTRATV
jgi:predicted nucleic acid-binding protein